MICMAFERNNRLKCLFFPAYEKNAGDNRHQDYRQHEQVFKTLGQIVYFCCRRYADFFINRNYPGHHISLQTGKHTNYQEHDKTMFYGKPKQVGFSPH